MDDLRAAAERDVVDILRSLLSYLRSPWSFCVSPARSSRLSPLKQLLASEQQPARSPRPDSISSSPLMRSTVAALASVLLCSSDVSSYALGGASNSQRLPHLSARSHRSSVAPVLTSVAAQHPQPLEPAPEEGDDCLPGMGGSGCIGTTGTVPMTINLAKNIAGAVLSLSLLG